MSQLENNKSNRKNVLKTLVLNNKVLNYVTFVAMRYSLKIHLVDNINFIMIL